MKKKSYSNRLILLSLFLFLAQFSLAQEHILVHTVEEGQTLYSISKTYNVTTEYIRSENPSVDENFNIKPGQILRIRLESVDHIETVESELSKKPMIHKVQAKETLYGVSKAYDLKVEDIVEMNKLEDNRIKIGQELIIGWRYEPKKANRQPTMVAVEKPKPEKEEVAETEIIPKVEAKEEPRVISSTESTSKQYLLESSFSKDSAGKSTETIAGPAIWFNTENRVMNSRYYGLFSDVPVGSVVKVKNLINEEIVFVKIIGSLPDTAENHGAMIKLTPAAKKALKSNENKVRVEITFVK